MTEPSVENLRKASRVIYIAVEKVVADDISNLLKWSANEIERMEKALTEIKAWGSSSGEACPKRDYSDGTKVRQMAVLAEDALDPVTRPLRASEQ